MSTPSIPAETEQQQGIASNPNHSAWVSANAGSGKTHVLTERVVRLLLNGTAPSRILCLTFTKAAAGEMSNRVFKTLGEWAMLDDAALTERLITVNRLEPNATTLKQARTLFAKALETPGGLKIQTIHAFCEALLHQFPLEANVPGNFTVMDDSAQKLLMQRARRDVVLKAQSGQEPEISAAFSAMMGFATDFAIDKVMGNLVSKREDIMPWLDAAGGAAAAMKMTREELQFGHNETSHSLIQLAVEECVFDKAILKEMAIQCSHSEKSNSNKLGIRIEEFLNAKSPSGSLDALCDIFLTSGKPRAFSHFCSKDIKAMFPDLEDGLAAEIDRLLAVKPRINTLIQIEHTEPLMVIAQAMLRDYRNQKRSKGLLDFDDLVMRTADLLRSSSARSWVLYKLDLGIDHILLDEAQDTSPRQWLIVNQLVSEFFAGNSARAVNRTIFAVGDEKQSIYSFQGARPQAFSEQRNQFEKSADEVGKSLRTARLNLSFRSTPEVLGAVDKVFGNPQNQGGLIFDGDYQDHEAQRRNNAGQVEIWQRLEPDETIEPEHWHQVSDALQSLHQAEKLAKLIAGQVALWLENGETINTAKGKKRIKAGDIIILVRSRDRFIPAVTRALKEKDIPVAGADRLALTSHIAVRDLIALGRVMLTPQDDLSLAALLKSPLLGLNEEELFSLAHGRRGFLIDSLRKFKTEQPFAGVFEKLSRWLGRADRIPVYEFYALILGEEGGREEFYSRLGQEAEDVLDAFLAMALNHEQNGLPGLHGFIEDLEMEQPEIKREFSESQNEVRVMTVHAAKGLEAPVVFVVDKSAAPIQSQHAPALYEWTGNRSNPPKRGFLWVPSSADHGDVSYRAKGEIDDLALEEFRRLLYVAMTRAEDRLIMCGYKGSRSAPAHNWYDMVDMALADDAQTVDPIADDVACKLWRLDEAQPSDTPPLPDQGDLVVRDKLPPWINHKLPQEKALPRPLNPSGAQALIDESLAIESVHPSLLIAGEKQSPIIARKRGTVIHRLLQVWPDLDPDTREQQSLAYAAHALPEMTEQARQSMVTELAQIIASPKLAPYLDPDTSRAEVPVMGRIELATGPRPVSGTIDRLAVLDDHLMALDYKTSRHVPETENDVPGDYITQMALYRTLVSRLYPDKPMKTALVWTHAAGGPKVMELSDTVLDAAMARLSKL